MDLFKMKYIKLTLIVVILLILSACSAYSLHGKNADEDFIEIQSNIKEFRKNLAILKIWKFKEKYPKDKNLPELDLFVADEQYNLEQWGNANLSYKKLLVDFPSHEKKNYIEEQIQKSEKEMYSFHPHFSWGIYLGKEVFSSGSFKNKSSGLDNNFQMSVSYFFTEKHGIFISLQNHLLKANSTILSPASSGGETITSNILGLGYEHRRKISKRWNLRFGVGAGLQRTRVKKHASDEDNPNYPYKNSIALIDSIGIDYCWLDTYPETCWRGLFPSISLFHSYIPNGQAGNETFKGHLIGLGFGVKI